MWGRWGGYIKTFFRLRSFELEWDGKVRGFGQTNIGVPQGSPLSPVVFLVYMAPILDEIESRLTQETAWRGKTLDVECPSFVDDIMASLMDWEGTRDMSRLIEKTKGIVEEIANKWNLPLETSKTESLILKRRRKRGGICYVKRLGIILDDTLQFDLHWQARIKKARNLLGAFNSIGTSQYGISPRSWRQLYTGMIRTVALWGSELGWRGQLQF